MGNTERNQLSLDLFKPDGQTNIWGTLCAGGVVDVVVVDVIVCCLFVWLFVVPFPVQSAILELEARREELEVHVIEMEGAQSKISE